jgi:hypothetical protein
MISIDVKDEDNPKLDRVASDSTRALKKLSQSSTLCIYTNVKEGKKGMLYKLTLVIC